MFNTIKNKINLMSNVDMTIGKPTRTIIIFAIPLMIGNLFQQFYNMVDTMVVGQCIGTNALASVEPPVPSYNY